MTLILLMALFLCIVVVIDIGQIVNEKVELQSAADAGSLAGASLIADSLNTLAVSNWVLVGTTLANIVTLGEVESAIKAINETQQSIIDSAPIISAGIACAITLEQGADVPFKLNRAANGQFCNPSLMVEREKLTIIGIPTPWFVVKDKLKQIKNRTYGDRYIMMGALKKSKPTAFGGIFKYFNLKSPSSISLSQAAVEGGKIWELPAPWPSYHTKLVPFSDTYNGNAIRH